MRENLLVANECRRLLYDFAAKHFPRILLPGMAVERTDYDPYRYVPLAELEPYFERISAMRSEVPIEWRFGDYAMRHASELFAARLLQSTNVCEMVEVIRAYQKLAATFIVIAHKSRPGALIVNFGVAQAEDPLVRFMFRCLVALYLHRLFEYLSLCDRSRRIDAKAADLATLLRRVSDTYDGLDITWYDCEVEITLSDELLACSRPDRDPRLSAALESALRQRCGQIPAGGGWKARIAQHIRLNQLFNTDIDRICVDFRIERRALTRILRQEGTTYTAILNEIRRDKALRLVRNRDVPLKRVATESGFRSDASFNMAFKSWTGLTPLTFRKRFATN